MGKYRVERITSEDLTPKLINWIIEKSVELQEIYPSNYPDNTEWFKYFGYFNHVFLFCFEDDKPRGFYWGTLGTALLDDSQVILRQVILYSEPGSRACKYLVDSFIDFGKQNANLIVTTIGMQTNIKPESLQSRGFKVLEVDYAMEVGRE